MYQKGDQITIISFDIAKDWNFHDHDGVRFAPPMLDYCGQSTIITAVHTWVSGDISYGLDIDNGSWNWIPAMFKQVEQVEPEISFF